MALSEKHRSSIYQGLARVLGEEEAQALLSQFPARDLDEPVTKEFVRAEMAEVRLELADVRADLLDRISDVAAGMHRQTVMFGSALGACTALLATIGVLG